MKTKYDELVKKWEEYGEIHLLGKTIVKVRYLSENEQSSLGWGGKSLVLQFNDGTVIYSSTDDEGNGPGALFGNDKNGNELTFPVV